MESGSGTANAVTRGNMHIDGTRLDTTLEFGESYNWPNYGEAIAICKEDEQGRFFVGNGEYLTQVNYCPWCGAKAPTQIQK